MLRYICKCWKKKTPQDVYSRIKEQHYAAYCQNVIFALNAPCPDTEIATLKQGGHFMSMNLRYIKQSSLLNLRQI